MSKYPTQEVALIPSPVKCALSFSASPDERSWFPGHLCIMQTPVGNVQVLNLHLRPPLNKVLRSPDLTTHSHTERIAYTRCVLRIEGGQVRGVVFDRFLTQIE